MSFVIVAPEPVGSAQVAVVPFDVSTYVLAPIGRRVELLTPLPRIRSPVLVTGDRALKAALAVVWPVPPLRIGSVPVTCVARSTPVSAPPSVRLPLDVTVPDKLIPLTVPVPDTLVTVPAYWSFDVMVKLGYVPEMLVVPAPVSATTWSGRVLVIVKLGYVPDVLMPVPPVNTTVWSGAELLIVIAVEPL